MIEWNTNVTGAWFLKGNENAPFVLEGTDTAYYVVSRTPAVNILNGPFETLDALMPTFHYTEGQQGVIATAWWAPPHSGWEIHYNRDCFSASDIIYLHNAISGKLLGPFSSLHAAKLAWMLSEGEVC